MIVKEFIKALKMVRKVIDPRNRIPVLTQVRITNHGDNISLSGTNLTEYVRVYSSDTTGFDIDDLLVDAKDLSMALDGLEGNQFDMRAKEDMLYVTDNECRNFGIPLIFKSGESVPDLLPKWPELDPEQNQEIVLTEMDRSVISRLPVFCSKDEMRLELMFVSFQDGYVYATDGWISHRYTLEMETSPRLRVAITPKTAQLLPHAGDTLRFDKVHCQSSGALSITSRIYDGLYWKMAKFFFGLDYPLGEGSLSKGCLTALTKLAKIVAKDDPKNARVTLKGNRVLSKSGEIPSPLNFDGELDVNIKKLITILKFHMGCGSTSLGIYSLSERTDPEDPPKYVSFESECGTSLLCPIVR